MLDLKILLLTVMKVFGDPKAYGKIFFLTLCKACHVLQLCRLTNQDTDPLRLS